MSTEELRKTEGSPKEWPERLAKNAYFEGIPFLEVLDRKMELRCLNCGSTDLRKVSLLYQEGRSRLKARTRVRCVVFGTDGPDLIFGHANTAGILQTQLSKDSQPPAKWSYLKLLGWLAFGLLVALVAYVHEVMGGSGTISSLLVSMYVVALCCLIFFVVGLFWRHNHLVYPREHAKWDRSFLCQQCGSVTTRRIEGRES